MRIAASLAASNKRDGTSPVSTVWCILRTLSVSVPALWNIDIGTIEFNDGRAAEQPHRAVEVGAQNFDGAIDAGFSSSGEAISVGASAEHGAGAEAEGLDDVGPAADASV